MSKLNWKGIIGWGVAIAVIFGIVGYNAYQSEKQATTGRQKIYAVLPLSGNVAFLGKKIKGVIDYATQKHTYPFEIVYVDSESNPMKSLTALQTATIAQEKPIVLSFMSSVGSAIVPYIKQQKGFLFTVTTKSITADVDSFLHMDCDISDIMNPLVERILKKYNTLDIVYIEDDYGLSEKNYLVSELNKHGFNDIRVLGIPLNIQDPKNEVTKLLSKNPEVIVILGNPTLGYINLFKQIHLQDFKGDLMTAEMNDPDLNKMVQPYMEGMVAVVSPLGMQMNLSDTDKQMKERIDESKTGLAYLVAMQVLDALSLIEYTITNSLPFTRETYNNLTNWMNVLGNNVAFKGERPQHCPYPLILGRYQNGTFIPVEK
ncbi:MAG: ABC transporter substrate-binding protein [Alphaproteobacteria bacterium]|nr:ABC transporter substrate-binding protein [Alphaproteobacteria bacterium]